MEDGIERSTINYDCKNHSKKKEYVKRNMLDVYLLYARNIYKI